jgi:3,4-dihydroxy-2-butanone 4-phosphate synthase
MMPRARGRARRSAWLSWVEVGQSYVEMSAAAVQVVSHRTQRMIAAAGNPNATDRREFALMGREKVDAAAHSAYAVGSELLRMNYRAGTQAWVAMVTVSTDTLSLAASRTPGQVVARQARLNRTLRRAGPTAASLSAASLSLTRAALKPVHSRAMRNAKRLRGW